MWFWEICENRDLVQNKMAFPYDTSVGDED